MSKLLLIQVSPKGSESNSRKAAKLLIEQLKKKGPLEITERDLAEIHIPHVDGLTVSAYYTSPDQQTTEQKLAITLSDTLVNELLATDTVVISTPMWNFGPPSILKAWIDHVVRAGKTFAFGEKGLEGKLAGKKVYVVASSGSVFSSGPFSAWDHLGPYFKSVFGFMGVTDVQIIRVEGTNDPASTAQAHTRAEAAIHAIE